MYSYDPGQVFVNQTHFMSQTETDASRSKGHRSEYSGHLTPAQIGRLIALALISQRQELLEANSGRVYATDRDEFLDLSANQSVNVKPSTETGETP
jgi:hypothetical protein